MMDNTTPPPPHTFRTVAGRPNIYEQQARNNRATVLLFVAYVILFGLTGAGIDLSMSERFGSGLLLSVFTIPIMILMVGYALWKMFRAMALRAGWGFSSLEDDFLPTLVLSVASIAIVIGMFFLWLIVETAYMHHRSGGPLTEFDKFVVEGSRVYFSLPYGTMAGVLFGVVSAVWGYYKGTSAIVSLSELAPPNPEQFHDRQFINVVEEMSIASGVARPHAYVLDDEDPNAFSIGTSSRGSCVVVTTGLLNTLDRDELQAVVAHEISHIRNHDTRVMTLVSILFGSILFLTSLARRGSLFGAVLRRKKLSMFGGVASLVLTVVWLLTVLFAPLVAKLLAPAVSRNREYLADASAAELTRNPEALVKALQRLENASAATESVKSALEHLCVVDPHARPINQKEGFWANLLSTHPPMKRRLIYLRAMAYQ